MCPSETYKDMVNSTDYLVRANFPRVPATDNVGVVGLSYLPSNGTWVAMKNYIIVYVFAWDAAGNNASCTFSYEAQRE